MVKDDTYNIDDVLARVREAWIKTPELRFGQFLVGVINQDEPCPKLFYLKDIDLRGRLDQWVTKNTEIDTTEKQ